jgi:DNA adenine methylase
VSQTEPLRAPFPWFGGKRDVADIIWQRLGNVTNYVEPFFGSGAVMLARPHAPKTETINDADHYVSNFWRAVQSDPDAVARHADWPVNETDLHARHWWLITEGKRRLASLMVEPDEFCPQVAGWWLWGTCSWIGSGFCSGNGPWQPGASGWCKPGDAGRGVNRKIPHLGDAGRGINRQIPHLGTAGRGEFIAEWLHALAARLDRVRVCSGDWSRVTGPSVTHRHGLTGVFVDPPYADTANRTADLYATDSLDVAHEVRHWAIEEGRNPLMRICLAGYDGEHAMPDDWDVVEWKAKGGFGSQSETDDGGRANARRERLWFSPACIKVEKAQRSLFDLLEAIP